jgi:phenylalanyl-tRNA synthetase beta chain
MKIPLSWLKDFVDISIPIPELAGRLTLAGLEVEEILLVGLPLPESNQQEFYVHGHSWDPEKIVVAAVHEVMPHPNADRLVLCRLYDGVQEHIVLTGAPNLYPYKGQGNLDSPLKVPYAKEGARIYDGHQPGHVLTTLKRTKIRGVESYSMICSEKELGISEEHEGVIILDEDAPVGTPLVDYMGDAVFDIAIIPNIARNANILGVAREVAALTGEQLRRPDYTVNATGPSIEAQAAIEIRDPELNPRFVLGLLKGVTVGPSPYWVQRRLRLAGMRPINNIVDATNYAMLELGEPLHAFDYDVLVERAGGKTPTIITRRARSGERLTTLDDEARVLDDFTVLVTDTAGPLSIAGVIGGLESEVNPKTRNVLLEGAAWNFINIRRTSSAQKILSEAGYRFSRGVHPAMAERGVRRCLTLMNSWGGGEIAEGLVDEYPLPPKDPLIEITPDDVERWLGIRLSAVEIGEILGRLDFTILISGDTVVAQTPDHRLDIGTGITGRADIIEEIARIYGYDRIPETYLADELPPQQNDRALEEEERIRDLLVNLGLQEIATYRLTTPEREARRLPPGAQRDDHPYVRLANPIASDRDVLRHSLLASLLETVERNARLRERIALFEIAPVFLGSEEGELPEEPIKLSIVLAGQRRLTGWQEKDIGRVDFYDMKGLIEALLGGLRISGADYVPCENPTFHPGKCARVMAGDRYLGVFGELHPMVYEKYDFPPPPLLAAEFDLAALMNEIPETHIVSAPASLPPVLEDLALVVDESIPAQAVVDAIQAAGGKTVSEIRLFDVYRGEKIGPSRKSLAFSLTYQDPQKTLTDENVAKIRQRIIKHLEQELGAKLRS